MTAPPVLDIEGLRERIYGAVPPTHGAYLKLLSLLEISWDDAVPSACVTLGARSRLLLNPAFVATHCRTGERLGMLVLHELMHVVLGHTRMYRCITPAQNLAFDAVINAELCRLLPHPGWTVLFRDLYRDNLLPEALLRPPAGWGTGSPRWRLTGGAGEVHRALYAEGSVTVAELLALVERFLESENGTGEGGTGEGGTGEGGTGELPTLLGSHEPRDRPEDGPGSGLPGGAAGQAYGGGDAIDPEMAARIREALACRQHDGPQDERWRGAVLEEARIEVRRPCSRAVNTLARALAWAGGSSAAAYPGLRPREVSVPAVLPWWSGHDRRAGALLAAGSPIVLSREALRTRAPLPQPRIHVYLDVSDSVHALIPVLCGAVLPVRERVHPRVHLFSTVVADVSFPALRRGEIETSRGTNIDCVTGHMRTHGVSRAVIVTDGEVGEVPEEDRRYLGRCRIALVVTWGGVAGAAEDLGARVFHLPPLGSWEAEQWP